MSTATLWFDTYDHALDAFLGVQRLSSVFMARSAVGDESVTLTNGDVIRFRMRRPIKAEPIEVKAAATPLSPRDVEVQSIAIQRLTDSGYFITASVVAAVTSGDLSKLETA